MDSSVASSQSVSPGVVGHINVDDDRQKETRLVPAADSALASIMVVGSSFKDSPLAFREEMNEWLSRHSESLRRLTGVKEYAKLVTCNRVELVFATEDPAATEDFFRSWSSSRGSSEGKLFVHKGVDAITHLFSVAAGLDSMVIGEEQILGQVREAGIAARKDGSSKGILSALFDASVSVGGRARKSLATSGSPPSVSRSAILFALQRLKGVPRIVLLVGTGKTVRLAANHLDGARVYVATRRSKVPSIVGARVIPHSKIAKIAEKSDLIISATKHDGYVLKAGHLTGTKDRVILDLAFPRNVDPELNKGGNEVYNLDDLSRILMPRQTVVQKRATELVQEEAERFSRWLLASRQSSSLSLVYRWAENLRAEEAEAALRRLPRLTARERNVVRVMSKRLVSKILAPPTKFTKSSSRDLPQDWRLEVVRRVFDQAEGT